MSRSFASLIRQGSQARRKPAGWITLLLIIVVMVARPSAAQQTPAFNAAPLPPASEPLGTPTDISLLVGRSTVLNVGSVITRVSLTVPDVADAMVTAPSQILIHGKQPGTISLFVWDRAGAIKTYEVTVRRDLSALKEQLAQLFPGETITVHGSGKDVVLSGTVSGQYAVEKAAEVAGGYVDKKENVVNLLKQQEGIASNQVMLRVRFAEVSRSAMTELGASLFTGPAGFHDYVARVTTQQFPTMDMAEVSQNLGATAGAFRSSTQGAGKWGGGRDTVTETGGKGTFSDLLNFFLFNNRYNVGTVVRALQEKGLFQSLAEPNLIATNGKEASFLAGGEYPYPVVQPTGSGVSYSIQFKEFGVRLKFTPTVLGGDLVHLKVQPEVSALDFTNAIILDGFRIPALSTRRTETEVELRDGQTFAIAGLLNNTVTDTMRKIPGIGDVPILGWLFKSKAMQKNQTELVVMITPVIMRKGSMGVSEGLPANVEPFLGAPGKRLPAPQPYTNSPRFPANSPAPRDRNMTDAGQPVPAAPVAAEPAPVPVTTAPRPSTETVPATPPPSAAPPTATPAAAAAPPPATRRPTKDEQKALERLQEEQRKAAEAAARQQAAEQKRQEEADRVAARRAAKERAQAERLGKERAKREAEVAKRNEELARRKAEEDARREKAVSDAAARLKEAQAAYEAEVARTRSGKGGQQ